MDFPRDIGQILLNTLNSQVVEPCVRVRACVCVCVCNCHVSGIIHSTEFTFRYAAKVLPFPAPVRCQAAHFRKHLAQRRRTNGAAHVISDTQASSDTS